MELVWDKGILEKSGKKWSYREEEDKGASKLDTAVAVVVIISNYGLGGTYCKCCRC